MRVSVLFKAITPDTKNCFGHSVLINCHGSSGGISSPASLGEETFESQYSSQSKKYDKWTNEEQKYLVQ